MRNRPQHAAEDTPLSTEEMLRLRTQWLQRLKEATLEQPLSELNALWRASTNDPLPLLVSSTLLPRLARRMTRLVERRATREPLARITGAREFASLTFSLNKACLVPRADSETLLQALLTLTASPHPVRNILELGCGCGCIALALAKNLSEQVARPRLTASDISAQALVAARSNARNMHKRLPVRFFRQNWSAKPERKPRLGKSPLDLLFANPPYIRRRERITLAPEVARFDPPLALDGGFDGMRCFRHILRYAQQTLRCGGFLVLEHDPRQTRRLKTLAQQRQLRHIRTLPDLTGQARVSVLRKHPFQQPFVQKVLA